MSLSGIPGFAERAPCALCGGVGLVGINGEWYCADHLDAGFSIVGATVKQITELAERAAAADEMGLVDDA
jgi:hypothetical protein